MDDLKMIDVLTDAIHKLMKIRSENKTLAIGVHAKKYGKTLMESKKAVEEFLDS